MNWTIAWVTVVALALCLLAVAGMRTNRPVGGVAIAAAAFGWAFARWAWIDVNWFLVSPLEGGWVWLTIILLIASLATTFVWLRVAKLIGWISLFIAVFTPYILVALVVGTLVAGVILMSRKSQRSVVVLVATAALVAVAVGGIALLNHDGGEQPPSADPSGTPSATQSGSALPTPTETVTTAPESLDENKLAEVFAKEFKKLGFKEKEVSVGTVDWKKNPVDHRGGAFGNGVKSQEELTEFLNSDTPEGQAARRHVLQATPESEHERVLNGDNYIPVQYNVDIQYGGNGTWVDGKLVRGGKVVAEAGDVFWVFVGEDYTIYWDASVRSDCENPGVTMPPRPHRLPPGPSCPNCGPPTSECPPGWFGTPPNCLQPKDPSQDPAAQGNAPEGGGHNDTNGPGSPNPQPTFPSSPHTNPATPSSSPSPHTSEPPATGAPDSTQAPSTCVPAPGDSC